MKKLLFILLLALPLWLGAQPYEHGAGIRAGYSSGLSYKGFLLHRMSAIEAGFYYNPHGLSLSAMYLIHKELDPRGRWLAYAGGGFMGAKWEDELAPGLTGGIGLEYVVHKTPLTFGLDWRPLLKLYPGASFDPLDFGLSIRYRFSL